jgi:hypothetical protein
MDDAMSIGTNIDMTKDKKIVLNKENWAILLF